MPSKHLKIVVLSSTQFGYRCLEEGIIPVPKVDVVGIMTTPRQINISYSENPIDIKTHTSFNNLAARAGCEIVEITGTMNTPTYLAHLRKWEPDLLIALGWYYFIPRKVRDLARLGCTGIHASLLPHYGGNAPLTWAIINGETETGVTFFYLEDEIDSGDIVTQKSFSIEPEDTIATVYEKATRDSVQILREYLPKLQSGTASRKPQDQCMATYFPARSHEDGEIDWDWNAVRIKDFIRAQTKPYPGAFTFIGGKKVIIWDAEITEEELK